MVQPPRHPDVIRLIVRAKGALCAVMITEAMEATGIPDGVYSLCGQWVLVKEGATQLDSDTLAGSVLTMPVALGEHDSPLWHSAGGSGADVHRHPRRFH